jgi:Homeodomain-like domain
MLVYRKDPSFFAVGRGLGLHHRTAQRYVERTVAERPMTALDDRRRLGSEPNITLEAKAWLVSLACRKAKELGYPHELWTTRLLARRARKHDGVLLKGDSVVHTWTYKFDRFKSADL